MYEKIISKFQNLKISKRTAGTFLHRQFFVASSFWGKGYKVKGEGGWRVSSFPLSILHSPFAKRQHCPLPTAHWEGGWRVS
jgi:hypothetical protein